MNIITNISLSEFEAWSGAVDTIKYLTTEELETVEYMLTELYPEGMEATQLNDILWFEDDMIAEWLGYNEFEEIINERS